MRIARNVFVTFFSLSLIGFIIASAFKNKGWEDGIFFLHEKEEFNLEEGSEAPFFVKALLFGKDMDAYREKGVSSWKLFFENDGKRHEIIIDNTKVLKETPRYMAVFINGSISEACSFDRLIFEKDAVTEEFEMDYIIKTVSDFEYTFSVIEENHDYGKKYSVSLRRWRIDQNETDEIVVLPDVCDKKGITEVTIELENDVHILKPGEKFQIKEGTRDFWIKWKEGKNTGAFETGTEFPFKCKKQYVIFSYLKNEFFFNMEVEEIRKLREGKKK